MLPSNDISLFYGNHNTTADCFYFVPSQSKESPSYWLYRPYTAIEQSIEETEKPKIKELNEKMKEL